VSIDALVFDFDGLILDTEWPEFATVRDEFGEHGVELLLDDWQDIVGRADHRHWFDWLEAEVGRSLDRDAVIARRRVRHEQLIAEEAIRPGVVELLDEAEAHGVPVAVASSSSDEWVSGHLDRLGVLDRFAAVRCRDHVERAKPFPDLFLAAVTALDADPQRSVAFEDSHHGCSAAKAAGLVCVVAPNDVTRGAAFERADLVVASLIDVSLAALTALVQARIG
jgi:HAD superfamily hydrolase (TIGR01509 family)